MTCQHEFRDLLDGRTECIVCHKLWPPGMDPRRCPACRENRPHTAAERRRYHLAAPAAGRRSSTEALPGETGKLQESEVTSGLDREA